MARGVQCVARAACGVWHVARGQTRVGTQGGHNAGCSPGVLMKSAAVAHAAHGKRKRWQRQRVENMSAAACVMQNLFGVARKLIIWPAVSTLCSLGKNMEAASTCALCLGTKNSPTPTHSQPQDSTQLSLGTATWWKDTHTYEEQQTSALSVHARPASGGTPPCPPATLLRHHSCTTKRNMCISIPGF